MYPHGEKSPFMPSQLFAVHTKVSPLGTHTSEDSAQSPGSNGSQICTHKLRTSPCVEKQANPGLHWGMSIEPLHSEAHVPTPCADTPTHIAPATHVS